MPGATTFSSPSTNSYFWVVAVGSDTTHSFVAKFIKQMLNDFAQKEKSFCANLSFSDSRRTEGLVAFPVWHRCQRGWNWLRGCRSRSRCLRAVHRVGS